MHAADEASSAGVNLVSRDSFCGWEREIGIIRKFRHPRTSDAPPKGAGLAPVSSPHITRHNGVQALEVLMFPAPLAASDLATSSKDAAGAPPEGAGRQGGACMPPGVASATESAGVVGESSVDNPDRTSDWDLSDRTSDSRDQHNGKSRIRRYGISRAVTVTLSVQDVGVGQKRCRF